MYLDEKTIDIEEKHVSVVVFADLGVFILKKTFLLKLFNTIELILKAAFW